ncbi:helix-turn-helix domain-containing protein [Rhizobium paknamense]|uniref:Transcriptional regulator with XRE-family HTH domain n=1 Tax=Rhizobium paknamense TaxID=1206817 RepID=A0ABU0IB56_9HYPH|nr:XRE family transcriptional regulator [Rhizobium paknamense]MDQ0455459.1 transcriptional regulator with XRE-family HTH domain [Rhizobium paknamense]
MEKSVDQAVAERLRSLRVARGLTLDGLAEISGVSRAMISRIERAEASPTASLLARLCSALGHSLSAFFADTDKAVPLLRRADQPVWRDPESGYLRRAVSPGGTGSKVDVVEVEFPPGATVRFPDPSPGRRQWQHVWLFEGRMELTVAETVHRLEAGDCLYMNVAEVRGFHNPGPERARYAVIIDLDRLPDP